MDTKIKNDEKKKSPFRALIMIPIMLVITGIVFVIALALDTIFLPEAGGQGHPMPVISFIAMMVMIFLDAVIAAIAILITIVRLIKSI